MFLFVFPRWRRCGTIVAMTGKTCLAPALWLLILLAGCSSGTVVVVATPPPPDAAFQTYVHATGVFSLRLPPDWAVNDLSAGQALFVEFSPPGAIRAPLTVYVLNTGAPLSIEAFDRAINDYQALFHSDSALYSPRERIVQADGSWLMPALCRTSTETLQLNTFFQREGSFFAVVEVLLPSDSALFETLNIVIDTFAVNPNVGLATGQIEQAGAPAAVADQAATGVVGFAGLFTWTDTSAGFHINGQVINNDTSPLEFVRVTARLFDAAGARLAEQSDFAAADVLEPGQYAPFGVLFIGGRPPAAVRYELHAAARHAGFAAQAYYGPANFEIVDRADYDEHGHLVVEGTVRNNGASTAEYVKVTVTIFDDQGRVVATDTSFAQKQQLLPGESTGYQITFFELGGDATRYISTAQATLGQ
jgi:hypothetical protein